MKKRGFTLVELLVVIAIIGVLIALLLPAVQAAREAARRAQCTNNLKQLALALHNHHDVNKYLPPGTDGTGTGNREMWGWGARILPYIEQENLYDQLRVSQQHLTVTLSNGSLRNLSQTELDAFVCPSDDGGALMSGVPGGLSGGGPGRHFRGAAGLPNNYRVAKSNYVGVCGNRDVNHVLNDGVLFRGDHRSGGKPLEGIRFADVTDGTSNTFCIGERNRYCNHGAWIGNRNVTGQGPRGADYTMGSTYHVINDPDNTSNQGCSEGFSSNHPTGALFAFLDGSVSFIPETINSRNGGSGRNNTNYAGQGVFQALGVRQDGKSVTKP